LDFYICVGASAGQNLLVPEVRIVANPAGAEAAERFHFSGIRFAVPMRELQETLPVAGVVQLSA
jgi:hypothetical protein